MWFQETGTNGEETVFAAWPGGGGGLLPHKPSKGNTNPPKARGRRRCTRTPTLQRCSLPSICRSSNVIIAMLVLNITEVQNQSLIKYLGADDLAHTQLDPQRSSGRAGDGGSWRTGLSYNAMLIWFRWIRNISVSSPWPLDKIYVPGSQVAIRECVRYKSPPVPEDSARVYIKGLLRKRYIWV